MLSVAPFFGGQSFSMFYRIGLAFLVSLLVIPIVNMPTEFYRLIEDQYFFLIMEQIFIGFLIGIGLQFLFAAFQMAGEFFAVQMGFGISEVFDPLSQTSLPLMGTVKNLIAIFVFFVSGSHLWLIKAVVYSYEKVPYLKLGFMQDIPWHKNVIDFMIMLSAGMFVIALKIAIPVVGTLFLVAVTMGILSKAAPQMNILMLGFPLKILIAFLVLTFTSPMIVELMSQQFDIFFDRLDTMINAMRL